MTSVRGGFPLRRVRYSGIQLIASTQEHVIDAAILTAYYMI